MLMVMCEAPVMVCSIYGQRDRMRGRRKQLKADTHEVEERRTEGVEVMTLT